MSSTDASDGRSWLILGQTRNRSGDHQGAEDAYRNAIAIAPELAEAHFGLGVICFLSRRHAEAARCFQSAIALEPNNPLPCLSLGHASYMVRDFVTAVQSFEMAARFLPLDPGARRRYARSRVFQMMIEGQVQEALDAYASFAGDAAEDLALIAWDAFFVLSASGHRDAAVEIGNIRLAQNPDDPIQRYLLDAVAGKRLPIAPADYVENYFDRFAAAFEHKLVDGLHYHVPRDMPDLIARHRTHFDTVLDLGCGTGLAAPKLAALGSRLVGVDLSGNMLQESKKRGLYHELVKADVVDFLRERPEQFDLIFAADVLIYIGDLVPLFDASATALRDGGMLAVSIETTEEDDFVLLTSGRFAQSMAYMQYLAKGRFDIIENVDTTIRLEVSQKVPGKMIVMRRCKLRDH